MESFTEVYEFTAADHQVSVALEDIPAEWPLSPADRAFGFAQLSIAEGEELAADLGANLDPGGQLAQRLYACRNDVCQCPQNARRAAAKSFAGQVRRSVPAVGWMRSDIGLPTPDLHFTASVDTALMYGPAHARTEYRFDAETPTVQVVQGDERRTWRPLDAAREALMFVWESAEEVQLVLNWPAEKARTAVAMCVPEVTSRWRPASQESFVAKVAACLEPLGDDLGALEQFSMLLTVDPAQDPDKLVAAFLAAGMAGR
jgi:hypothetical protein